MRRKHFTPTMTEVAGIPASTKSIVRTLIVNSIRMVIRKKVIKEREAFIKGEFSRITTILKDLKADIIIIGRVVT